MIGLESDKNALNASSEVGRVCVSESSSGNGICQYSFPAIRGDRLEQKKVTEGIKLTLKHTRLKSCERKRDETSWGV